jgi:hypothetical protein
LNQHPPATGVSWRALYLRALAAVYCIAFVSLGAQLRLLAGADGLAPIAPLLDGARGRAGVVAANPTLFWLGASDAALCAAAAAGAGFSLLLFFLVWPRACLAAIWILYLSLTVACGDYLGFQWDNLLLESAVFSFLYASKFPHPAFRFLLLWLVFRENFESGVAKLNFGDAHWSPWDLSAMKDYYETAPLPTWLGWYAHQMPAWAHKGCAAFTLVVELLVPFLLLGPLLARRIAVAIFFAFQSSIELTGNYFIFNILSLVLCIPALEPVEGRARDRWLSALAGWRGRAAAALAALLFVVSIANGMQRVGRIEMPKFAADALRLIDSFRSINSYHLFAQLTLTRPEVEIQGSDDGSDWRAYDFVYKPGDVMREPGFVAPHQPRVDFRLWFAARLVPRPEEPGQFRLAYVDRGGMLNQIVARMSQKPEVTAPLFRVDPFAGRAPRYIRLAFWRYQMTNFDERSKSGAWWKRTFVAYHPYVHDTKSGRRPEF